MVTAWYQTQGDKLPALLLLPEVLWISWGSPLVGHSLWLLCSEETPHSAAIQRFCLFTDLLGNARVSSYLTQCGQEHQQPRGISEERVYTHQFHQRQYQQWGPWIPHRMCSQIRHLQTPCGELSCTQDPDPTATVTMVIAYTQGLLQTTKASEIIFPQPGFQIPTLQHRHSLHHAGSCIPLRRLQCLSSRRFQGLLKEEQMCCLA